MKEQLISFETAKLAKEKGFDISTANFYTENYGLAHLGFDGETLVYKTGVIYDVNGEFEEGEITFASTQSFLQKWLREKHNLHIFIGYRMNVKKWDSHVYNLNIKGKDYIKDRSLSKFHSATIYDSYEEALEAGLQEALKLI